jgi:biotin operon repressor
MAYHSAWSKKLEEKLKRYWRKAGGDRDIFKELILADEELRKRGRPACEMKAYRMGLFKGAKLSKRFAFSRLGEERLKELDRMLTVDEIKWPKVKQEFPGFTVLQFRNWAKGRGIKINKGKPDGKSAKESVAEPETTETSEQRLIKQREVKLLKRLKNEDLSIPSIADDFNTSEEEAVHLVDSLMRKGYDISFDRNNKRVSLVMDPVTLEPLRIDSGARTGKDQIYRHVYKVLLWDSSVFGSKYSQLHLMQTLYAYAEREGVDFAIGSGVTAGIMSKRRQGEVFLDTAEQQREYALKHIPEAHFKTYLISGKRDLSHKARDNPAYNIVRDICSDPSRDDLVYRGDLSAIFFIKGVRIEAINPGEDFAPYAKSLPLQRIMENMFGEYVQSNSDEKVVLALFGSHMFDDQPDYMITRGFLVPTLQAITPHQKSRRRRGFTPILGGVILHIEFDEEWHLKENGIVVEPVFLNRYKRENGYLAEAQLSEKLTKEQVTVIELLAKRPRTEGEISRILKVSKRTVWKIIRELKKNDYEIQLPTDPEQADSRQFVLKLKEVSSFKPLPLSEIFANKIKIGFTSDKHYASADSQPSCINRAYVDAEKENIEAMCDTGDLTAGFVDHPSNRFKVIVPNIEGQALLAADCHPRPKFRQYLIAGDHDLFASGKVGIDLIRRVFVKERPDITYLGQLRGDIDVKGLKIRLMHPGGGPGYALSYQAQKRIESEIQRMLSRGGKSRYDVLALGNWHVANWQFNAGVAVIVVPCFQEQTIDYMMRKGLSPWIGMWIMEFICDKEGFISAVKARYYSYAPHTKEFDFPGNMSAEEFFKRYMFPGNNLPEKEPKK